MSDFTITKITVYSEFNLARLRPPRKSVVKFKLGEVKITIVLAIIIEDGLQLENFH